MCVLNAVVLTASGWEALSRAHFFKFYRWMNCQSHFCRRLVEYKVLMSMMITETSRGSSWSQQSDWAGALSEGTLVLRSGAPRMFPLPGLGGRTSYNYLFLNHYSNKWFAACWSHRSIRWSIIEKLCVCCWRCVSPYWRTSCSNTAGTTGTRSCWRSAGTTRLSGSHEASGNTARQPAPHDVIPEALCPGLTAAKPDNGAKKHRPVCSAERRRHL